MAQKETVTISLNKYNELRDFKSNIQENGYLIVTKSYIPFDGIIKEYLISDLDLKESIDNDFKELKSFQEDQIKALNLKHKEEVEELKKELEDVKSNKWWKFLF